MPEVRLLETLQCLFDRGCVLHKSVHLEHWLGISECGHFPQCIVRPGARGMMRRRGYMFTLCCLTSFFISSADCSSAVRSTRVCVLWDVNKRPLIVSLSCRNYLRSALKQAHAHICIHLPLLCGTFCFLLVCPAAVMPIVILTVLCFRSKSLAWKGQSAHMQTVKEKIDCKWVAQPRFPKKVGPLCKM